MELCSESDAGNVLSALTSSLQRLTAFQNQPQALSEAVNLLASAQIQVEEAIGELNRFVDHFDADPERQQMLEERLDTIYTLARKHRVQPSELPNLHQQLLEELEGLNADDEAVERLGEELAAYARHYEEKAGELSRNRQAAAEQLASAVEAEIQRLGMPGGRFSVQLKPAAEGEYMPYGRNRWSSGQRQPWPATAPAGQGRVGRRAVTDQPAIQVITAQTSRVPTLVFDEVDVGIGGPTAEIVGQLLRRLGERGQVLTVTHLPQVAAQGHHHLFVHKARDTDETRTAVTELDRRARRGDRPDARRRRPDRTIPGSCPADGHLRTGLNAGRADRVGGGLTAAVLPHHRAYGSVHGGSGHAVKPIDRIQYRDQSKSVP